MVYPCLSHDLSVDRWIDGKNPINLLNYYMYPPVNQNKDNQSIDMKTPAFAEHCP
jgi:hypothetical protein